MIIVAMPYDVRKKKTKAFKSLTIRKIICLALSLSYAIPVMIALPIDSIAVKIVSAGILAVPVAACGWFNKDGQPLEVWAARFIVSKFLAKKKRVKKLNYMTKARKELEKELEKEKMKKMKSAELKRYMKYRKKGVVKYSYKDKKDKLFR